MKGAIFCLMAFCVSLAVCDDTLEKLKISRERDMEALHGFSYELYLEMKDECGAARKKGGSNECTGNCVQHLNFEWDYYFVSEHTEACEKCHELAEKLMDIKLAEKCCTEEMAVFEKKAEEDRAYIRECLSECVQEATRRGTKRRRED